MFSYLVLAGLSLPALIGIIAGAVVLVIGIILFFVFGLKNSRMKKDARDLLSLFEGKHAILFGQDAQYILRMQTISATNLTYAERYQHWNNKFVDVRDISDSSAQSAVNDIKVWLETKNNHDLKENLPNYKIVIEEYASRVDSLTTSLKAQFEEEEKAKVLMLEVKDRYRGVKQRYNAFSDDLSVMEQTFRDMFLKIDQLLDEADAAIESAYYDTAIEIYDVKVRKIVDAVDDSLNDLPEICVRASSILPDKISSLRTHYNEMSEAGYPLHHILLKGAISEMEELLSSLINELRGFHYFDATSRLDLMEKKIENYNRAFAQEREAKISFEKERGSVYAAENQLQNKYVEFSHILPQIREAFKLTKEEDDEVTNIKTLINTVSFSKTSLDTYIHASSKQPYTSLVEKMGELKEEVAKASEALTSFTAKVRGFFNDVVKANEKCEDYSDRLYEIESDIRSLKVASYNEKYAPTIEELFSLIDEISSRANARPVEIGILNSKVGELTAKTEALEDEIREALDNMHRAEKEIVLGNRYRKDREDINTALEQAEKLLLEGKFAESYELSCRVLDELTWRENN